MWVIFPTAQIFHKDWLCGTYSLVRIRSEDGLKIAFHTLDTIILSIQSCLLVLHMRQQFVAIWKMIFVGNYLLCVREKANVDGLVFMGSDVVFTSDY